MFAVLQINSFLFCYDTPRKLFKLPVMVVFREVRNLTFNKKGISTLIASVLIIGFTVALAAVIIAWSTSFVTEQTDIVDEETTLQIGFANLDMKLVSVGYELSDIVVTVENTGSVPIENLIVRSNGEVTYLDLVTLGEVIGPLGIGEYSIGGTNAFVGDIVEVIPGINYRGKPKYFSAKSDKQVAERISYGVFVTSASGSGNLGSWSQATGTGLDAGDSICQSLADDEGLKGSWKAWLSIPTPTGSASQRLDHSNLPYKRIDKKIVANNWNDLISVFLDLPGPDDVYLRQPISIDETGVDHLNDVSGFTVWTNTDVAGLQPSLPGNCGLWTFGTGSGAIIGQLKSSLNWWTISSADPTPDCSILRRLYCFEQPA